MNKKHKSVGNKATTKSNKTKTVSNSFGDKSPVYIRLCLGHFITGLHMNFLVTKEGKKLEGFATLALNDKTIGHYDMKWSHHVSEEFGLLASAELLHHTHDTENMGKQNMGRGVDSVTKEKVRKIRHE